MDISSLIEKARDFEKKDVWDREAARTNKEIIAVSEDMSIRAYAYMRLAKCFLRHGFLKETISLLKQAKNENNQEILHFILGCQEIQKELTDYQKERRQVSIEFLYEQQNYHALIKYGKIFKIQDMFEGAIEAYTKAAHLNPINSVAFTGLGAVYAKMGNFKEAREAYNEALKLSPDDTVALRGVSKLFSMEGKGEISRTLWRMKHLQDQ